MFTAWMDQEHAAHWWGPQGFTIMSCRLDGRVGGGFRIAMRGPDGTVRTKRGVYQEIIAPELLVFTYAWEDANGDIGHEMRVTVTLQPRGSKTLLTLHQTGFESNAERDSHQQGWTSCLQRFSEYLATVDQRQHQ